MRWSTAKKRSMARTVLRALRNADHPSGAAADHRGPAVRADRARTPAEADRPPTSCCWVRPSARWRWWMVGITLALTPVGRHWRGALVQALRQEPAASAAGGRHRLGARRGGIPLTVMVVAAALPIGANVFPVSLALPHSRRPDRGQRRGLDRARLGLRCRSCMVWVQWLPDLVAILSP